MQNSCVSKLAVEDLVAQILSTADNNDCAKAEAARALWSRAFDPDQSAAIIDAGGIEALVSLLYTERLPMQTEAARALWNLAANGPDIQSSIARAGSIEPLVNMLKAPSMDGKECAAGVLRHLALNISDNRKAIAAAGAIWPLVDMVRDRIAAGNAAGALMELALESSNRESIAIAGGIDALLSLVKTECRREQDKATCALINLAADSSIRAQINKIGGAAALLKLASGQPKVTTLHASTWEAALRRLQTRPLSVGELADLIRQNRAAACLPETGPLTALSSAIHSCTDEKTFCASTLHIMIDMIPSLPQIFDSSSVLVQGVSQTLLLHRPDIFAIMSGALLGLVPPQPSRGTRRPDFDLGFVISRDLEKCKALILYFVEMAPLLHKCRDEQVSFQRSVLPSQSSEHTAEFWRHCYQPLAHVTVRAQGTKDDVAHSLHADFANSFIGGGVLMGLTASEEITFAVCPELLVSLLFCERMLANEAIVIVGAQRWAQHTGYGSSFRCVGAANSSCDAVVLDSAGRRGMHLVAMDAMEVITSSSQFEEPAVMRELVKAVVAFRGDFQEEVDARRGLRPVATGNWGCGTFGGDPQLKFIVQWMACSVAGRDMIYFTHGDDRIQPQIDVVVEVLSRRYVGEVFAMLLPEGGIRFSFDRVLANAGTGVRALHRPGSGCTVC